LQHRFISHRFLAIAELIVRKFRNESAALSCVTARVVIVAACAYYMAASVILRGFLWRLALITWRRQ
jgi:hypothetical protein